MGIIVIKNEITEAQASAVYFVRFKDLTTREHSIILDIGGATTEISHWHQRELLWEDSVKFAGIDLITVLDDFRKFVDDKVKQEASLYDNYMRRWSYVHKNWDGKMEKFYFGEYKDLGLKTLRTICLFFSGIAYYIGLHLRRMSLNEPLGYLAFVGNGIHFLDIVTLGNEFSEENRHFKTWIIIFCEMLKKGHGLENEINYNTKIIFSDMPKVEVALGLTSDLIENYESFETQGPTTKKCLD